MKQVFIIAGPNGSGKTTLAKELLVQDDIEFVNADEIAREINPEDVESVRIKAGKSFLARIRELIKKNKPFMFESTLSGKYSKKLITKLRDAKFRVIIVFVFVDNPEIAINRIKVRINNDGHYISDKDVIRRFYRSKNNFWNIYKNMVDEWELFYNGEKEFLQVAIGKKEHYTITNEEFFNTFLRNL
ncbi:MAG: hypothetical protein DRH57_01315 [Candidatus Cloacimonadota bacterium]|nr:MAG: hypothetical protein DRH57_01315 [Candidatus Cloacimonadota bacterium]